MDLTAAAYDWIYEDWEKRPKPEWTTPVRRASLRELLKKVYEEGQKDALCLAADACDGWALARAHTSVDAGRALSDAADTLRSLGILETKLAQEKR